MNDLPYSEDVLRLNPELRGQVAAVPASKYHNARTEACGLKFDSGKEAAGVADLITLEQQKAGVYGLRLQVAFPLPGGLTYRADATYIDDQLVARVIDFKGFKTKEYIFKRKLFLEKYGKEIEEV